MLYQLKVSGYSTSTYLKLHKIQGRSKKYLTAEIAETAEKKI